MTTKPARRRRKEGAEALAARRRRTRTIIARLEKAYPDAKVALSTDHTREGEPLALARVELRPDEGIVVAPASR